MSKWSITVHSYCIRLVLVALQGFDIREFLVVLRSDDVSLLQSNAFFIEPFDAIDLSFPLFRFQRLLVVSSDRYKVLQIGIFETSNLKQKSIVAVFGSSHEDISSSQTH